MCLESGHVYIAIWEQTEPLPVYIYIYSKSDDFPIQMYSPAELEHGPQLRPYIPRAGGQDDGSSTTLPQSSAGGTPNDGRWAKTGNQNVFVVKCGIWHPQAESSSAMATVFDLERFWDQHFWGHTTTQF